MCKLNLKITESKIIRSRDWNQTIKSSSGTKTFKTISKLNLYLKTKSLN